jgi:MFS family permease
MRIVGRSRLLTGLFVGVGLAMVGEGLFVSLIVPFTKVVLGGDASQLGWLMSAQAIGGVAGGLLLGKIGKILSPLRQIAIAGILDGLLLLGVINGGSVVLALILITLAGLPIVALFVSVQTLVQTHTEDQHRGRVFGALSTVSALMTLAGMGIAAALGDRLGIAPTLSLGGVAYLLAGLYALTIRPVDLPVAPSLASGADAPVAGN